MTAIPRNWTEGPIEGCDIREISSFEDDRGWLVEFFRHDELPRSIHPAMGYLSLTHPGVARGPHEHNEQTDLFLFFDGRFRLYLWDARPASPTFGRRRREDLGASRRAVVVIPPGVVHAYHNVGDGDAFIINCPNRLYAGKGKEQPVDEIRHEDRLNSPYVLD